MMMWMMWSVAVATLLGFSAHLGEWTLRDRDMAGRWPWALAMGGALALPAVRRLLAGLAPVPEIGDEGSNWLVDPEWLLNVAPVATARTSFPSEILDSMLLWGWVASACLALAALASGVLFLRARSARWRRTIVGDHEVLVSEDFGPALVGVRTPRIVLPAWALQLPEEELRLACLHEVEHRDAGDLRLLFAGAVALSLMPWNPALWWQVRRLRTAVEMDCDARVLGRGVRRRSYGRLLLELGSGGGRSRSLPALALAQPESLLERRMKMIVRSVNERHPVRGLAALAGSVGLVLIACDTPPPTYVDSVQSSPSVVEEAVGSESESVASVVRLREKERLEETPDGAVPKVDARFFVDGEALEELPEDLEPSEIDLVKVSKGVDGEPSTVRISTLRSLGQPLVYLDGARFRGGLSEISKEDIERIEILKGKAAAEAYGDAGRNGVIQIFSKGGAGERTR